MRPGEGAALRLQQAALRLSGGALTKARRGCIGANGAVIRPFDPLTTPLRGAVPSPLQGEFGPQAALSAALRAARLTPNRIHLSVPVSQHRSALASPPAGRR